MVKLLCISDMHKRHNEATSIKGLPAVQTQIVREIIEFIKSHGITHVLILGDWYDRGYHGTGPTFGAIEMDRQLSAAVNGNVFLCIGNHFYLERDDNPEMYVIQPNAYIKPQIEIPMPEKPIFQLVPTLRFGTVQVSFFHYNKLNKDYVTPRSPECTFHIGIYHDEAVVPAWIRETEGFTGSVSQRYMNTIYNNIDLAIHGHIHSKIGMATIELDNGRKVPLCIPGAMVATQNKETYKFKEVQLPVIEISDDSVVSMKLAPFSTHLDELVFSEVKKSKKKQKPAVDLTPNEPLYKKPEYQSLVTFLAHKGYEPRELRLIDAALSNSLSLPTAVRILAGV